MFNIYFTNVWISINVNISTSQRWGFLSQFPLINTDYVWNLFEKQSMALTLFLRDRKRDGVTLPVDSFSVLLQDKRLLCVQRALWTWDHEKHLNVINICTNGQIYIEQICAFCICHKYSFFLFALTLHGWFPCKQHNNDMKYISHYFHLSTWLSVAELFSLQVFQITNMGNVY